MKTRRQGRQIPHVRNVYGRYCPPPLNPTNPQLPRELLKPRWRQHLHTYLLSFLNASGREHMDSHGRP